MNDERKRRCCGIVREATESMLRDYLAIKEVEQYFKKGVNSSEYIDSLRRGGLL